MLAMLNTWEVVGIVVIAMLLFGAKKLPELAKGLTQSIREFRKASKEGDEAARELKEP